MRKITKCIVSAVMHDEKLSMGNSYTDEKGMYLFRNKIAWKDELGRLWIDACGWKSVTTKERLNGLPNVSISQKDYVWYLNGEEWDGRAIMVK